MSRLLELSCADFSLQVEKLESFSVNFHCGEVCIPLKEAQRNSYFSCVILQCELAFFRSHSGVNFAINSRKVYGNQDKLYHFQIMFCFLSLLVVGNLLNYTTILYNIFFSLL